MAECRLPRTWRGGYRWTGYSMEYFYTGMDTGELPSDWIFIEEEDNEYIQTIKMDQVILGID